MTDRKRASREEDFRDYEERDIRDGWPYPDSDSGRRAGQNAPYGASDRLNDEGVEIAADPSLRDVEGAPSPYSDGEDETIADDDLEGRVTRALEDDERVDLASLDITIRDGVAELDGAVDSEEDRRHLVGLLLRVKGVREVRAEQLLARGVDSHIPRDVDE